MRRIETWLLALAFLVFALNATARDLAPTTNSAAQHATCERGTQDLLREHRHD